MVVLLVQNSLTGSKAKLKGCIPFFELLCEWSAPEQLFLCDHFIVYLCAWKIVMWCFYCRKILYENRLAVKIAAHPFGHKVVVHSYFRALPSCFYKQMWEANGTCDRLIGRVMQFKPLTFHIYFRCKFCVNVKN